MCCWRSRPSNEALIGGAASLCFVKDNCAHTLCKLCQETSLSSVQHMRAHTHACLHPGQRWLGRPSEGQRNVECQSVAAALRERDPGKIVLDSKHPVRHPCVWVCALNCRRVCDCVDQRLLHGLLPCLSLFVSYFHQLFMAVQSKPV